MGYQTNTTECNYRDFILDYNTMNTKFDNLLPSGQHKLCASIKSKEGFIWRLWSIGKRGMIYGPTTTENSMRWDAPVLKSNLQKAIRLQDRESALKTTLRLALVDQQELYRRLPIIAVEDVCLIKGTSTIVWLMMVARKNISVSEMTFVARYVDALCLETDVFFNNKSIRPKTVMHKEIAKLPDIAALNIRAQYGGMKGDIDMLKRAVYEYDRVGDFQNPMSKIPELELPRIVSHDFKLLSQGIDFHPYPWIIGYIHSQTNLPKDIIKSIIWNAESGPNNRKKWTIEKQAIARAEDIWPMISQYLNNARSMIIKHSRDGQQANKTIAYDV